MQKGYQTLFNNIENNQRIELIRKHTQTYDLRHFILPAFESILHALANVDQDGDDESSSESKTYNPQEEIKKFWPSQSDSVVDEYKEISLVAMPLLLNLKA